MFPVLEAECPQCDVHERLAIRLLQELSLGQNSAWHTYIEILPKEPESALSFSLEELDLLHGSYGGNFMNAARRRFQNFLHRMRDLPHFSYSESAMRWAMGIVLSRSFSVGSASPSSSPFAHMYNMPFLAPGADFMNHNPHARVGWTLNAQATLKRRQLLQKNTITSDSQAPQLDDQPYFSIVLLQNIPNPWTELYNNYHDYAGNAILLSSYGFVVPNNPYDTVTLRFPAFDLPPVGKAVEGAKNQLQRVTRNLISSLKQNPNAPRERLYELEDTVPRLNEFFNALQGQGATASPPVSTSSAGGTVSPRNVSICFHPPLSSFSGDALPTPLTNMARIAALTSPRLSAWINTVVEAYRYKVQTIQAELHRQRTLAAAAPAAKPAAPATPTPLSRAHPINKRAATTPTTTPTSTPATASAAALGDDAADRGTTAIPIAKLWPFASPVDAELLSLSTALQQELVASFIDYADNWFADSQTKALLESAVQLNKTALRPAHPNHPSTAQYFTSKEESSTPSGTVVVPDVPLVGIPVNYMGATTVDVGAGHSDHFAEKRKLATALAPLPDIVSLLDKNIQVSVLTEAVALRIVISLLSDILSTYPLPESFLDTSESEETQYGTLPSVLSKPFSPSLSFLAEDPNPPHLFHYQPLFLVPLLEAERIQLEEIQHRINTLEEECGTTPKLPASLPRVLKEAASQGLKTAQQKSRTTALPAPPAPRRLSPDALAERRAEIRRLRHKKAAIALRLSECRILGYALGTALQSYFDALRRLDAAGLPVYIFGNASAAFVQSTRQAEQAAQDGKAAAGDLTGESKGALAAGSEKAEEIQGPLSDKYFRSLPSFPFLSDISEEVLTLLNPDWDTEYHHEDDEEGHGHGHEHAPAPEASKPRESTPRLRKQQSGREEDTRAGAHAVKDAVSPHPHVEAGSAMGFKQEHTHSDGTRDVIDVEH